MIRFYAPDIETDSRLPEVESGHCCRVLRMRTGDEIEVVDGKGNIFRCSIFDPDPRGATVEIIEKIRADRHWAPHITLAVAPTKNLDRMEWLAVKAVEIGVDRIAFLNCRHSVRRVMKRERIEKIMVSAMKQSLKAILPELVEMTDFADFVRSDSSRQKYFGYCNSQIERRDFSREYDGKSDVTVLIGPEGDFAPEEVELAMASGFIPVTFGNTRLRTETAALYALCAAHTIITQNQ